MPAKLKGFFFDLDGTLVDTYEADYLAYRDAIKDVLDIDISRDNFMKTNGMEAKDKLGILAPEADLDDINSVRYAKKHYYKKYVELTRPNHTLIAFVNDMAKHHIVALVTTAKRHNADLVLEQHRLKGLFKVAVYGDDVNRPKPHPESYNLALEMTGLSASEVIAFEDSQSGHDAAHAAGIATVDIRSFS